MFPQAPEKRTRVAFLTPLCKITRRRRRNQKACLTESAHGCILLQDRWFRQPREAALGFQDTAGVVFGEADFHHNAVLSSQAIRLC